MSACLPQRQRQKYLKYHHLAQQPQAQLGFDDFESVNMVRYLPISDQCLGEIRAETRKDQFLQELSETILVGWPEHKDYTPATTHPYFSMRDEVTVQDGLVFKGNSVVIPWSLRADMKMKIHSSHLGIEACLQVARESAS